MYEQKAVAYLAQQGYGILETNYRCHLGEIDIIAQAPDDYVVFIEVKYRRSEAKGWPGEAVNYQKRLRISKAAVWYLMTTRPVWDCACRFDVIEFMGDQLHHIEHAFEYMN